MKNNKDIKHFYIYADKNSLYIKNINEQTEKLSNNIHAYSANIDDNQNIHICGLDTKGRLSHFFNYNGSWKRKFISKPFNSTKYIKDMRLYILNNRLNIFLVEKCPISDELYKVSHFNFSPSDYKICKYVVNNIYKENEHIYKLNIDEMSNIVFEYNKLNTINRSIVNQVIVFNSESCEWTDSNSLSRGYTSEIYTNQPNDISNTNIKDDIFDYCYSIKYK